MIRSELKKIIGDAIADFEIKNKTHFIEQTSDKSRGDYAANAALIYAKECGKNPKELAEIIAERVLSANDSYVERVEVAGPGFINITISDEFILKEILLLKNTLSKGFSFRGGNVNIEFISANPTGALHIGHGRGAFYGDVLSRVLEYCGMNVTREFYINNSKESKQIIELGKTALGNGEQYKTLKIEEKIARLDFSGMNETEAGFLLAKEVQKENALFIENTLGVKFDIWYSEDEKLRGSGIVIELFDIFNEKDFVYEKDGAWWLKTSEYGDDEDRVVKRSDGTWSYFMNDIAYHADKIGRGYDRLINVWGADHHGHIKRMLAVKKMLGLDVSFEIFITQLVSLKKEGVLKKMSKRAGTVVLLEDIVREVGIDALRWFYIEKTLGTHMEFDVELAKKQSTENPVYYVQYAHARAAGILENIIDIKSDNIGLADIIKRPPARALAMKILQFPEIVEDVSRDYFVHKITTYSYELASQFNQFYRDFRVVSDGLYSFGGAELTRITKDTLAKSLSLLGILAPEKM